MVQIKCLPLRCSISSLIDSEHFKIAYYALNFEQLLLAKILTLIGKKSE